MAGYKPLLINEETYDKLKKLKVILEKKGEKTGLNKIVASLVSREYLIASLDEDVKLYLDLFIEKLRKFDEVLGAVLFGSVARGTYNKYSDIDLFILVKESNFEIKDRIYSIRNELNEYEDKFIKKDIYLYISPMIVGEDDLKVFKPIYIDIAKDGILLFEKGTIISDFFREIKKVKTSYDVIEGVRVIKWKQTE